MSIIVNLSPELETSLHERAVERGQDIEFVVSEILVTVLDLEKKDLSEATMGIQQCLDDFATEKFSSFQDFAEEQCKKIVFYRIHEVPY
jgi:hypothetical protein